MRGDQSRDISPQVLRNIAKLHCNITEPLIEICDVSENAHFSLYYNVHIH